MDRSLPFGLRSAPNIFNAITDFLAWVLHHNGIPYILHYLDDFLILTSSEPGLASRMRSHVEAILNYVGAPIAHRKTEGPSTVLTFLGIQVDTSQFLLSLLVNKVYRLCDLLSHWRYHCSCTKRELQSFLSHLSHAATVIWPGRVFLRSLFSLLSRLANPCHYARLNLQARMDIAWLALLITPLEQSLLLSSCISIIPPVLQCLWVIWLRGL